MVLRLDTYSESYQVPRPINHWSSLTIHSCHLGGGLCENSVLGIALSSHLFFSKEMLLWIDSPSSTYWEDSRLRKGLDGWITKSERISRRVSVSVAHLRNPSRFLVQKVYPTTCIEWQY
ncbi:hypothetical protein AcW2_005661 [Taiwanofungus camphoratus]|nr:hypothetical protein AcW2_005661 [Antrodia cinnamomea]